MSGLICEKCHVGQVVEYRRQVGAGPKVATIKGTRCNFCGFTNLDNDEDVWSAVGL